MSGGEAKRAIGLMSGTSMDGIDVALVVTDGENVVERGPAREYPYSVAQRRRLEEAVARGAAARDACELREALAEVEADVTQWHGKAVERFEAETGERADSVGFHGHTVAHRPEAGWTLQIGDGARLAGRLGRTVVSDFRSADMRAGGQGAPLVPIYHAVLAKRMRRAGRGPIAFLNIGGISNVTLLREDEPPLAFDCGPGNVLVDRWVQREAGIPFDAGGRVASEGRVHRGWIEERMGGKFFSRQGPRSLDRLDFDLPDPGTFELADGARTLARFTAEAAARTLAPHAPELTIVCGGGRLNDMMLADLREMVAGTVDVAEAHGLDGGAMEAEAFAYLAVRCERGLPITFPTTTGCTAPVPGGRIDRP